MKIPTYGGVIWFAALPELFLSVGAGIVASIGEGIAGAWAGLSAMLLQLLHELPFGDQIADFFGLGGGKLSLTTAAGGGGGPAAIGASMAQSRGLQANPKTAGAPAASAAAAGGDVHTNVYLDGEPIYQNIQRRDELNAARK